MSEQKLINDLQQTNLLLTEQIYTVVRTVKSEYV